MRNNLKTLSVSKLNSYLTCPRAFYFIYVLGLKLPSSPAMFFGKAIHSGIEAFYTNKDPIKAFQNSLKQDTHELPPDFNMEKSLAEGERLIEIYKKDAPYFEPEYVEKLGKTKLIHPLTQEILDTPFSFRIDLITKNSFIVDHKTCRSVPKRQNETNRIQGIAYTMFYRSLFGRRPRGFIANYIVRQKRNPRVVPITYHYSPDDEAWLFDLVKEILGQIRNREYLVRTPLIKSYYPCRVEVLCWYHRKK